MNRVACVSPKDFASASSSMRATSRSTRRRTASTSTNGRRPRPRQRRQRSGQSEIEIAAPQTHHANQPLAVARRALPGGRELSGNRRRRTPARAPGRACSWRRSRQAAAQAAMRSRRPTAPGRGSRPTHARRRRGNKRAGFRPRRAASPRRRAIAPGGTGRPRCRRAPATSPAPECWR